MRHLTLELPANLQVNDFELRMTLAARLYEAGKLSSGQAATLAGISKRAFIELLGQYGVSVFGYDFEDIAQDLRHV